MVSIQDMAVYFCQHTKKPDDLSYTRMTKMIYLADWQSAKETGKQMTNIKWWYYHYGPYARAVVETIYDNKGTCFTVEETENTVGAPKSVISLKDKNYQVQLKEDEIRILKDVIKRFDGKKWKDFIEDIYATYPIRKHTRYDSLDLIKMAQHYKKEEKEYEQLGMEFHYL